MTPEGAVKKACEDLLKAERIPYWRMNAGNAVIPGRGRIRLNAPGTADLLAAPEIVCSYDEDDFGKPCDVRVNGPIFLWIETKRPKGKASQDQQDFSVFVRNRGHRWLLVDDVKILQDWLREHRAR